MSGSASTNAPYKGLFSADWFWGNNKQTQPAETAPVDAVSKAQPKAGFGYEDDANAYALELDRKNAAAPAATPPAGNGDGTPPAGGGNPPAGGGGGGGGGGSGSSKTNTTTTKPVVDNSTPTLDEYTKAMQALQAARDNMPTYTSKWDVQIDDLYNQIMNRDKFAYDLNTDTLYNQYRDNYTLQGQLANKDAQAQAAALTGGYGSTYSQAAGQAAYDSYLQQLNNLVPDLQNSALNVYNAEGEQLAQNYASTLARENQDYSRYQDDYKLWEDELGRLEKDEAKAYEEVQKQANNALTMLKSGNVYLDELSGDQRQSLAKMLGVDAKNLERYLVGVFGSQVKSRAAASQNKQWASDGSSWARRQQEAAAAQNQGDVFTRMRAEMNGAMTSGQMSVKDVTTAADAAYKAGDITQSQRDQLVNLANGTANNMNKK